MPASNNEMSRCSRHNSLCLEIRSGTEGGQSANIATMKLEV
ncbi:hypothetical protein OFR29_08545 [Brachyspira hyodysenteriae]|nr:hypothetical protein [Brachyspira hyodysenteriae]MDA0029518.1 hypothetical protein [Brachyspira hyodysenteriae]